jgi:hypothetical protein
MGQGSTELPATRFGILLQQFIDNTIELHKTRIFTQVILGFDEKWITLAITPFDCDFPWFLHRIHNIHFIVKV